MIHDYVNLIDLRKIFKKKKYMIRLSTDIDDMNLSTTEDSQGIGSI
jgi:hypothetical protein